INFATRRYQRGWSEQNPNDWIDGLIKSVRTSLNNISSPNVKAIGVTATGPTVVFTDENGNPIRPSMLWDDTRAAEIAGGLSVGFESITAKAVWLSAHHPEEFAKAKKICEATDWIIWMLTGRLVANKPAAYF